MSGPLRAVVRVFDVKGPRGGTIYVTRFACGHQLWNRTPPKLKGEAPCTGCYVDEQVADQLEAEGQPRDGRNLYREALELLRFDLKAVIEHGRGDCVDKSTLRNVLRQRVLIPEAAP